jgi:16S rRNA (adenine1518-N6/adenine1519-N6)-dimethyltransferase
MAAIDGLPPLREVIARHGLSAKKALGQNFLLDLNLTARIARAAGDLSAVDVLEIGPGPGGLTRGLLAEGARRVLAVEKDARCLPALAEIAAAYPGRLEVVNADALTLDAAALLTPPIRVVANLPYNIGTELLVRWLTPPAWPPFWESLTLMFQKEVAERLAAAPRSAAYGRLSVIVQWLCQVRFEFSVDARAFTPPPQVASAVVTLIPRERPLAPADGPALEQVTRAAFGQRRKMLRSSLKALGLDPAEAGIDPTERAEALTVQQFCAIARAWRARAGAVDGASP